MAITVANTTIKIERPVDSGDSYELETIDTVATGIRAVLTEAGGGRTSASEGVSTVIVRKLVCDPADLQSGDVITDESTLESYVVDYAGAYGGPLAHVTAQVSRPSTVLA